MSSQTSGGKQIGIMMTDEEFQEYHSSLRKEKLLGEMMAVTNKPFSVKNMKKPKNNEKSPTVYSSEMGTVSVGKSGGLSVGDEDWEAIMEKAAEINPSPIAEVTSSEMSAFRLEDIGLKGDHSSYHSMFKKEQAMLAEVLKDVSEQARMTNNKLRDMAKKSSGYGGVSKTYPDLISAANSLNSTRLSIIKEMASLKKTIADFELKKAKEDGGSSQGASNEDIADNFYKNIISNRKGFIESSMASISGGIPYYGGDNQNSSTDTGVPDYPQYQTNTNHSSFDDMDHNNDEYNGNRGGFQITSSLYGNDNHELTYSEDEADPYGYIRNETRDIKICVQRFSDGRLEFVAIDKDGEGVDGYELPGDDLLLDLSMTPMSKYATDSEGRRYRIIDIDSDGVDISDVLDDDSPSGYEDFR